MLWLWSRLTILLWKRVLDMSLIRTVPEYLAEGDTASMYSRAKEGFGYLPVMVAVFSHRPEVMGAWNELISCLKNNLDVRRYELVTIAAAKELRSS
ncbi:MAG TPA: hypothetical protein VGA60_16805 [Kiloniellales bacterium]